MSEVTRRIIDSRMATICLDIVKSSAIRSP